MSRGNTWTNKDGVVVGFGVHSEDNDVTAVYSGKNGEVTFSQEIVLTDLVDTAADIAGPQAHVIPRGSIILRADIQAIVGATSGTTSGLDIGTWSRGLATEKVDDMDGIVKAATTDDTTIANIGDVNLGDGDLIADAADSGLAVAGAISDSDVVITASWGTAVFTAGKIRLTVTYRPPTGSMSRVLAA